MPSEEDKRERLNRLIPELESVREELAKRAPRFVKLPETGEVWLHYKGGHYTIVGRALDDEGFLQVVYRSSVYRSATDTERQLFVQSLARFLQEVEHGRPRFILVQETTDA